MAKKFIKSELRSSEAKIEPRYFSLGYIPNGGGPNVLPALNLKGRWLYECGFVTGQPVTKPLKRSRILLMFN